MLHNFALVPIFEGLNLTLVDLSHNFGAWSLGLMSLFCGFLSVHLGNHEYPETDTMIH